MLGDLKDSPPARIPAWKKLGLKLRPARDSHAENSTSHRPVLESGLPAKASDLNLGEEELGQGRHLDSYPKKRKTSDREEEPPASKRHKRSDILPPKRNAPASAQLNGSRKLPHGGQNGSLKSLGDRRQSERASSTDVAGASAVKHNGCRRKSVTFSPDTKTVDGSSAKHIFKNGAMPPKPTELPSHGPEEDPDSDSTPIPSTEADALGISNVQSEKKKRKKKKKEKRSAKNPDTLSRKPSKASASSTTTAAADANPALTYLLAHHHSPSNWKFNKRHQTALFRHAFSAAHIPHAHDAALFAYVAGLRGPAAAARLRAAARTTHRALDAADGAPTPEAEAMMRRAEGVWDALVGAGGEVSGRSLAEERALRGKDGVRILPAKEANGVAKGRGRKARTGSGADDADDSSSSSSSSSSNEDEDSDDEMEEDSGDESSVVSSSSEESSGEEETEDSPESGSESGDEEMGDGEESSSSSSSSSSSESSDSGED